MELFELARGLASLWLRPEGRFPSVLVCPRKPFYGDAEVVNVAIYTESSTGPTPEELISFSGNIGELVPPIGMHYRDGFEGKRVTLDQN